jgi:hypothetical protein
VCTRFKHSGGVSVTPNENCGPGALACRERHIAAVQYVVSNLGYHVQASMAVCMLAAISIACSKMTEHLANASWLARNPPAKCNFTRSTWDPALTNPRGIVKITEGIAAHKGREAKLRPTQ